MDALNYATDAMREKNFHIGTTVRTVEHKWKGEKMYESPIKMLLNGVETSFEDGILKAVQKVNIAVDKEELLKALQYDRNQYQKGYADAESKLLLKHGEWIYLYEDNYKCSICGSWCCTDSQIGEINFCPNCGADMREG